MRRIRITIEAEDSFEEMTGFNENDNEDLKDEILYRLDETYLKVKKNDITIEVISDNKGEACVK